MADWNELGSLDAEELIVEIEHLREEYEKLTVRFSKLQEHYDERSAQLREAEALVTYLEKKLLSGNYYV